MMLKKTRRRLTMILTAVTGVVLAAALGVSLWFAVQQVQIAGLEALYNDVSFIAMSLVDVQSDSTEWITEMEKKNQYVVLASRNAQPVVFTEGWQATTGRAALLEAGQAAVEECGEIYSVGGAALADVFIAQTSTGVSLTAAPMDELTEAQIEINASEMLPAADASVAVSFYSSYSHPFFTFEGEKGEQYRASYMDLYMPGGYYELMVVQDMKTENTHIMWLCLGYAGLLLLGLAGLAAVNWLLSKMVLRPVEQGMRQQADFVAAASHELRSPLAVMQSSLSAAETAQDPDEAKKYRHMAADETRRMGRLVDDLLLLAGGDGSWKLRNTKVDIDTLLIDTGEQYTPLAKKQGVTLLLRLPEQTLGQVAGDADRLRQILVVLLDNALQYAPAGTGVVLGAKRKRNRVEISVIDQGDGIPEEEKEKVFERFFSGDKSRSDKAHFGLGLSVARELALLHDGSLTVKDTEGGGATFVLTLPLEPEDKPA